ncbi:hypothetical protein [Mycobacterium sp. 1081908.1]|uniref:hypothetical protein n=1 Tax=Mycobacterium sp. 1081908.1 TaxID=1834066 RepID=UPI000800EB8A|nr:hypothetical protein [Mycobacterium sp. 1081908.1]OBK45441.1 hypothetical protein A5655_12005 [Mycobacterium sp. 1081908.1]
MVSKILVSAALAVGAAVAIAAPAGADPSVFNDLSCSCPQTVSNGGSSVADQINRGIQSGLAGGNVARAQQ